MKTLIWAVFLFLGLNHVCAQLMRTEAVSYMMAVLTTGLVSIKRKDVQGMWLKWVCIATPQRIYTIGQTEALPLA